MQRKTILAVLAATAAVAAGIAFRVEFARRLGGESPGLFLIAIVIGAWLGGRGVGLYSTALALAGTRVFLPAAATAPKLLLHAIEGIAVSMIAGELHAARLRAEAAVRDRDRFLAAASHELKNPLAALHTALAVAARRFTDPPVAELLRVARRQVDRLIRLTNDLLEIGRVASGVVTLERSEVDLALVVSESTRLLSDDAAAAGCALHVEIAAPVVGRWDGGRLEQVVINLVSNAIKYGRGAPIDVVLTTDGDDARLLVRDRGVGIPVAEQEAIFEAFVRASSATLRGARGTGLGLWIVRAILREHGGAIAVQSTPGEGSTFTVTLPGVLRGPRGREQELAHAGGVVDAPT